MTSNVSVALNAPRATIECYSELTGFSIDTTNDMLADGRVPRHRLRKNKKREKVMTNLAALTVGALTGCNVVFNQSHFGTHQGCRPCLITEFPSIHILMKPVMYLYCITTWCNWQNVLARMCRFYGIS